MAFLHRWDAPIGCSKDNPHASRRFRGRGIGRPEPKRGTPQGTML